MFGSSKNILFFVLGFFPWSLYAISEMELVKMIDQRQYHKVIAHFPAEPTGAEPLLVLKAHAQLGLAGFEPLELIHKIKEPQSFSNQLLGDYFVNCPNVKLNKKLEGAEKCIVVRLFNQVPHHTNEMLVASRNTLKRIQEKGLLGKQDRFLYAIVELSVVLSKLREVLFLYNSTNPKKVSYDDAVAVISMIRSAGEDFESFVKQYKDKEMSEIFNKQFFGSRHGQFLQMTIEGKVEFLEKTGLPTFFKVTDMTKEATLQLAGRNMIIKIIDRADNFFRTQ